MNNRRVISVVAIAALAAAAILVPATTAQATPFVDLTVQLVGPDGVTPIGTTVDATAEIMIDASSISTGETSYQDYFAASHDSALEGEGYVYRGSIASGRIVDPLPTENYVTINTVGGPDYLYTYTDLNLHATPVTKNVKTVKGASLSGTVTNSVGTPVVGAAVTALYSGINFGQSVTDGLGNYSIRGLEAGSYRLQFNSRSTGGSASETAYSWNYWNNKSTYHAGAKIALNQQTSTHSASVKTNLNDKLPVGHTLTVNVNFGTSGEFDVANVDLIPHYYADYVQTYLDGTGATTTTKLIADTYRIEIWNDAHAYYWTGNGKAPTTHYSKAKVLTFTNTKNVTITFG